MGFEPTRAEHIGLAVQRLNHSATSSWLISVEYPGKLHETLETTNMSLKNQIRTSIC